VKWSLEAMESFWYFSRIKSTHLLSVIPVVILGTNGIIVSKKILTSIALGIIIFILLSLKVNDAYADIKFTDLSWGKFNQ
jgi:predicted membrane chloride channel (bestrophin family)